MVMLIYEILCVDKLFAELKSRTSSEEKSKYENTYWDMILVLINILLVLFYKGFINISSKYGSAYW
jgi:hypothetical protein